MKVRNIISNNLDTIGAMIGIGFVFLAGYKALFRAVLITAGGDQ